MRGGLRATADVLVASLVLASLSRVDALAFVKASEAASWKTRAGSARARVDGVAALAHVNRRACLAPERIVSIDRTDEDPGKVDAAVLEWLDKDTKSARLATANPRQAKRPHYTEPEMEVLEIADHCKRLGLPPIENETVTTEDGYHLTLVRIPNPGGKPVLLQHGIADSAWMWVYQNGTDIAGPLYKAGFDVWLGNNRGNAFSRSASFAPAKTNSLRHTNGYMLGRQYWNFTIEDIAEKDLPALVNHVYERTGGRPISFVGHSLGTTQMLVAGSQPGLRENLESKVERFIALSPIGFIGNLRIPFLQRLMRSPLTIRSLLAFPYGLLLTPGTMMPPGLDRLFPHEQAGFRLPGKLDDPDALTELNLHKPQGCSILTLNHFRQMSQTGRFVHYDYGKVGNQRKYGSPKPPDVNMSQFRIPTVLYFAEEDDFATQCDQLKFSTAFPQEAKLLERTYPEYHHETWYLGRNLPFVDDLIADLAHDRFPTAVMS